MVGPHVLVMSGTLGLAFAGWVATRTAAAEELAVLILVLFASVLVWQMTGSFYWSAFEWRAFAWRTPRGHGSHSMAGLRSPPSY